MFERFFDIRRHVRQIFFRQISSLQNDGKNLSRIADFFEPSRFGRKVGAADTSRTSVATLYNKKMAVSCTNCGRQYDVTLFQFGRTISCACGARVGFEHRLNLSETAEVKFFADVNVASVVRWLRAVGLDTAWEDAISDADLVRRAIEEKRFVLTLDKLIVKEFRADNVVLLSSEEPLAQFAEVIERFNIRKPSELFTRCLVCNTPLRAAHAPEIADHAPAAVQKTGEDFRFCGACRKIYWEGTHTRRMRAAIEGVFNRETR